MRITFLMPGYNSAPSGGFRVVYEYANRLVARGHRVSVVLPRRLKYAPATKTKSPQSWIREKIKNGLKMVASNTQIDWQPVDKRVDVIVTHDSDSRHLPDADVIFATSWHTVASVLECPPEKGEKCYFIQGYESYHADKDLVDDTWRAPLRKIVIAKWLLDLGKDLGCDDLTYIPNAINHERFLLARPVEGRPKQISMIVSTAPVKGSSDGIEALEISRQKYPDLKVVLFGVSRPKIAIPKWAEFHKNPPQDFIVKEIYNKSQVFVSASWLEGFALPPAEAAACGCALAATDSRGVREYIEHGVTGLLSPPKDPAALAENICLLLSDEPLRVRLAKAVNQQIAGSDWSRSTTLLEDFLKSVTRGERRLAGREALQTS